MSESNSKSRYSSKAAGTGSETARGDSNKFVNEIDDIIVFESTSAMMKGGATDATGALIALAPRTHQEYVAAKIEVQTYLTDDWKPGNASDRQVMSLMSDWTERRYNQSTVVVGGNSGPNGIVNKLLVSEAPGKTVTAVASTGLAGMLQPGYAATYVIAVPLGLVQNILFVEVAVSASDLDKGDLKKLLFHDYCENGSAARLYTSAARGESRIAFHSRRPALKVTIGTGPNGAFNETLQTDTDYDRHGYALGLPVCLAADVDVLPAIVGSTHEVVLVVQADGCTTPQFRLGLLTDANFPGFALAFNQDDRRGNSMVVNSIT